MPTPEERLQDLLHTGDRGVWTTAALVTALRDSGPEARRSAAGEVLRALDIDLADGASGRDPAGTAHAKFGGDPLENAVSRFKSVVHGGTPLDDAEASALLRASGFEDVRSMPTPPGAPALTCGRRPSG